MKPLGPLFFVMLGLAGALVSHAQTIDSLSVQNHSGSQSFLIASDRDNASPGYDRDTIRARAEVTYPTTFDREYRLRFSLLDQAGEAVPLINDAGQTVAFIPVHVFVPALTGGTQIHTAPLRPANRLDPYQNYRVRLQIDYWEEIGIARWVFVTEQTESPGRVYLHFTSTDSNDAALNVIARLNNISYSRTHIINTMPARDRLATSASITLFRYDGFAESEPPSDVVTVHLDYELRESDTGSLVAFQSARHTFTRTLAGWVGGTEPRQPVSQTHSRGVNLRLAPGVQLDSVNKTYVLSARISHVDVAGESPLPGNQGVRPAQRLLHFNGTLQFGNIAGSFTSISNNPAVDSLQPDHVLTTLAVNQQSGRISGSTLHTFGDGTSLSVRLRSNGNAELAAGTAIVAGPERDADQISGIDFIRHPIVLSVTGASATISALFPGGMGWTGDRDVPVLANFANFQSVALRQDLAPQASALGFSPGDPFFVHVEDKPLWLRTSALIWEVTDGEFEFSPDEVLFVREPYLQRLEAAAASLDNSDGSLKRSNDHFLRTVQGVSSSVRIAPGPGAEARLHADFSLAAGELEAHFPYGASVVWSGGQLSVDDGRYAVAESFLSGVTRIAVPYEQGCPDASCGETANLQVIEISPAGSTVRVTPEGGLHASGPVASPDPMAWGHIAGINDYAHRIMTPFDEGNVYAPGHTLDLAHNTAQIEAAPAVLLLSGVLPDSPAEPERPLTAPYRIGAADYAGVNFRVISDGALDGRSLLSGEAVGPYPLTGRSKYYARYSGVTGIHEAQAGSVPSQLDFYGYEIDIAHLGLTFLSSENVYSVMPGEFSLPYPAGFSQSLDGLRFSCLGALEGAFLAEEQEEKRLMYWDADFTPLAVRFRPVNPCDPYSEGGHLLVGMRAHASNVQAPLHGSIGFFPDGNIIRGADEVAGIDSRLRFASQIAFAGPEEENTDYVFTPASGAYFNHYPDAPGEAGFLNLAGRLQVAFFREMRVHVHTRARKDDFSSPIHVMGGAYAADYFTDATFDDAHRGFPGAVTLMQYRDTTANTSYRPRARQNWFFVPLFNYGVVWDPVRRVFHTPETEPVELVIVEVENRVPYLSAERAEILFGAHFDGIEPAHLTALLERLPPGLAVLRQKLDSGLRGVGRLLSDRLDHAIEPAIENEMDELAELVYADLVAGDPVTAFARLDDGVALLLEQSIGDRAAGTGVIGQFDRALLDMDGAFDAVIGARDGSEPGWIEKDPVSGRREIAAAIFQTYADLHSWSVAEEALMQSYLDEAELVFEDVSRTVSRLREAVEALRQELDEGGDVNQALTDLYAAFDDEGPRIAERVVARLTTWMDYDPEFFENLELPTWEEFRQQVRRQILIELGGSTLANGFKAAWRQQLQDLTHEFNAALDLLASTVWSHFQNTLAQGLAGLPLDVKEFLGDAATSLAASGIRGHAEINGNALRRIRLDGYYHMDFLGNAMEVEGFVQYRQFRSDGAGNCAGPADRGAEISFGVSNSSVQGGPFEGGSLGTAVRVDSAGKFSLSMSPFPQFHGLSGGLTMTTGSMAFQLFELSEFAAVYSISPYESYLAARTTWDFNGGSKEGGFFFGHACSFDPIREWDPRVSELLGNPPFFGIYAFGRGWTPLATQSCLLHLTSASEIALFAFVDTDLRRTYGGRMSCEVSGEILCAVDVTGALTLFGARSGGSLRLEGGGTVAGSVRNKEIERDVGITVEGKRIRVFFK